MGELGQKKPTSDLHLEEVGKFSSSAVGGDLGGERGITMRLPYFFYFPFPPLSAFCNLLSLVVRSFLVYQILVPNVA